MDEVFRALDDPTRRRLLDALFDEDGRSLGELCALAPEMTRFGVMAHLEVLAEAGLVTTRKVGRRKHHYLNPVPIRLVHDRWIDKYTEPRVGSMARLKAVLEEEPMAQPDHVYKVVINARPERVWNAIVDGDWTVLYFYGTRVASTWEKGAGIVYSYPDGSVAADGEVLAIDPGAFVEMTFHARWDPDLDAEGPVREIWRVEPFGEATRLVVEVYDMPADSARYEDFTNGLPFIVSGLKTLLETGQPLPAPSR
jgi:DNA-binding transcriptional ArsR family regulator